VPGQANAGEPNTESKLLGDQIWPRWWNIRQKSSWLKCRAHLSIVVVAHAMGAMKK
jgi:hypothetical protein